jgi:hypothetical protein
VKIRPRIAVLLVGAVLASVGSVLASEHPHFVARVEGKLLRLLPPGAPAPPVSLADVVIQCDSGAAGSAISPLIYGVAGADPTTLTELGATLNRWGGNPSDRYNWVLGHAWNAGRDWEFRNVNYTGGTANSADHFVAQTLSAQATPLMTVPALGWVAKDTNNDHRSTGVPDQGGSPVSAGSDAIAGYNPAANRATTSVQSLPTDAPGSSDPGAIYQDMWVRHLVGQFGASPKGVRYFTIGNEPDLWSFTDTDVHPVQMSYDQMVAMYEAYATAVKAQDPGAQILGPDVSGWNGLWYSALDRGTDNYSTHADSNAHGGQAFLPWWLAQIAKRDRAAGVRTLDYLDVHFYPQANGLDSSASDLQTQLLRIRSTRNLDDPAYVDESWIAQNINLIPRLKAWIAANYPGTKLAITEYNWGGEKDASGAIALAIVLGTFGRDGVDMASYWQSPPANSPAGAAFRLYRNYNGRGAHFGDRSIPCTSSASSIAVFAARHTDTGEVDVILANEDPNQTASIRLNVGVHTADRFQVDAGSGQITSLGTVNTDAPLAVPPFTLQLLRFRAS